MNSISNRNILVNLILIMPIRMIQSNIQPNRHNRVTILDRIYNLIRM